MTISGADLDAKGSNHELLKNQRTDGAEDAGGGDGPNAVWSGER